MRDSEFCTQVLKLDEGWSATNIEVDGPSNRVDISIAQSEATRSFFSWRKDDEEEYEIVRHLPIFGMRTFLHIPVSAIQDEENAWRYPNSPYTKAMEDLVIGAIKISKSIQGVSDVAGLLASEVREISERSGVAIERIEAPVEPSINIEPELQESVVQSFDLIEMEEIPLETHPNWMKVIQGQLELPSNAVGLKMLLQRVRQEVAQTPNETTKLAGVRLLRQYFVKNQATHREDIDVLNGNLVDSISDRPNLEVIQGGIPAEQHHCWAQIISGEQDIDTEHVGLQMMIERVRLSVANSPSESSRLAAAKILRQFFVKHKVRLSDELKQLGIDTSAEPMATTVNMPAVITVPATNHECWQQLLNGTLNLDTNAVGLQMMLERVRMSIAKNPTESNRAAGIKIIHQYFVKHQARHREEILTLLGQVVATPHQHTEDSHTDIPAENHPSWQRLIDGELEIMTDVVALKMMLERIRISVEKNPSESTRMAGAKILRQYFIKHQQKHRAELNQLVAA